MASEISDKEEQVVSCDGCTQSLGQLQLNDHRDELNRELEEITNYGEKLAERMNNPATQISIEQVNRWEQNAIQTVQKTAQECREKIFQQSNKYLQQMKFKLDKLIEQINVLRGEHQFNENDLSELKEKFTQLEKNLVSIPTVSIEQDSSSFIQKISVVVSSGECL